MAAATTTETWDALLTTTLKNYSKTLRDQISTANAFLFMMMKKQKEGYIAAPGGGLGHQMVLPLMYALTTADAYSKYDPLNTDPTDGMTSAIFDWRQMAVPITISRFEERQNSGEAKLIPLLQAKTKQAVLGIQELFGKALLQGNGPNLATAIQTAYTSTANGALFIDPLAKLIDQDPTSAGTIGNINQVTETWWRNQKSASTQSSYAGFQQELRTLNANCSKGPGGPPNLHLADQNVYLYYEAALAAAHRNPSYQTADIPFENIGFKGKPVVWDEFVPSWDQGTTAQTTTSGTWIALNLEFLQIQYDPQTNFMNTPFVKPENQDARTAHILWYGAAGCSNRRKQGVLSAIDSTATA